MLFNDYKKIIFLDAEANGTDTRTAQSLEWAVAEMVADGYSKLKVTKQTDFFVSGTGIVPEDVILYDAQPADFNEFKKRAEEKGIAVEDFKLPVSITELTHIHSENLDPDKSIAFPEDVIAQTFAKKLFQPDTLIMTYNLNYDLNLIASMLKKYDIKVDWEAPDYLDLLAVYKDLNSYDSEVDNGRVIDGVKCDVKCLGHRLDAALKKYDVAIDPQYRHRAIGDVLASVEVLQKMIAEGVQFRVYLNYLSYKEKFKDTLIYLPAKKITYVPVLKKFDLRFYSLKKWKEEQAKK